MLVYEKNSGWKVGPVSEGENIVTLTPDMVTEIFFFIMHKLGYMLQTYMYMVGVGL